MVYVQSTALEQVGYDPDRRCLRAKFRDSGRTYIYSEVPQEVYDSLLFAESVERHVGLPLDAVARVPVGVAVPPDDQPAHATPDPSGDEDETMSRSTNGIIGQSFHSLSRA